LKSDELYGFREFESHSLLIFVYILPPREFESLLLP